MKLIKNAGELRDLATVYLTRANGSVHDTIEPFEAALFEASPVIAGLFAGPSEALRARIAAYLDAIQSDLAYVFQEGIAKDEAITKALALEPSVASPRGRQLSCRWKGWRNEWQTQALVAKTAHRGHEH